MSLSFLCLFIYFLLLFYRGRGGNSLVEGMTPGQNVIVSIPSPCANCLADGMVSASCDRLRQKSCSLHSVSVWQHVNLSDFSLGTYLQDSLVAYGDIRNHENKIFLPGKEREGSGNVALKLVVY